MTWHVELDDNLDTSLGSEILDLRDIRGTIGKSACICTLLGQLRKSGDINWPGLGVSHVDVDAIELVPGKCIDCSKNVFNLGEISTVLMELYTTAEIRELG